MRPRFGLRERLARKLLTAGTDAPHSLCALVGGDQDLERLGAVPPAVARTGDDPRVLVEPARDVGVVGRGSFASQLSSARARSGRGISFCGSGLTPGMTKSGLRTAGVAAGFAAGLAAGFAAGLATASVTGFAAGFTFVFRAMAGSASFSCGRRGTGELASGRPLWTPFLRRNRTIRGAPVSITRFPASRRLSETTFRDSLARAR